MNRQQGIDPAQVPQITERIGQAFDFVHDVLEAPEILDEIPDGAMLFAREIVWRGEVLHLIAHPAKDDSTRWVSRITAPARIARTSRRWIPPIDTFGKGGEWGSPPTFPECGASAEAALHAFEEKLRDADHPRQGARRVV